MRVDWLSGSTSGGDAIATTGLAAQEGAVVQAARVHVVWNDAILQTGTTAVDRGFAAKVYLFAADSPQPIHSAGVLRFYAWRDDATHERTVAADRVWEFSAEEVEKRLQRDAVGWSYTFWLPWGPTAGPQQKFMVQASFAPQNGKILLSPQSSMTLAGDGPTAFSADRPRNAERE